MKDTELLKTVCDDIYALTGIKPTVYDANMRLIYAHPKSMGDFCRELRKDPAAEERCLACDREGFSRCGKTGEVCIYHCHMGLTEAASPILDRGTVIGYVLFGQLLEENRRDWIRARVKNGGFENEQRLLELLSAIEATEESVILASARLISMCASYVQLRHVVKQHKDLAVALSEHIGRNLAEDITIEGLCRQFGVSRGTLYGISKNAFGVGISEYIRNCRLAAAEELLRHSEMPIYQIGETVGIHDANYLTKLIKKRTGMTPKEYRNRK